MVKKVGKYEIHKTLGEGSFGKVKLAVDTETDAQVAIKILDKEKIQQQNMGAQIKKEISIMKMIAHPQVVKLYEVLASKTKIFIVLELVTGGELFDRIVKEGRFKEPLARFYWKQLIEGIQHCHEAGVAHRDLKPENLLLDVDGNLKITDFGLSALYTSAPGDEARATLLHTTCGTPNYVAPEVLLDKGYDGRAADVWSCGVILYVMLAGFLPFDEPHMGALFRKIQKAEFTYPSWFTPEVRALLDRILVPDPIKRIRIPDIQTHPWFTSTEGAAPAAASSETVASSAAPAGGSAASEASSAAGYVVPIPSFRGAMAAYPKGDTGVDVGDVDDDDASPLDSRPAGGEMMGIDAFSILAELTASQAHKLVKTANGRAYPQTLPTEMSITGVIAVVKSTVSHMSLLQVSVALVEGGAARIRVSNAARDLLCSVWATVRSDASTVFTTLVDVAGTSVSRSVLRNVIRALRA